MQRQRRVSNLRGQAILQVEQTRLADVLDLRTSLTDHGRLETHAISRVPAKDREWPSARSTFAPKFLFGLCEEVC